MARRSTANDRLLRLLAMIPWIAEHSPTIKEVCDRFGVSRANLLKDLDVVFMVGVHPFTPDELIDVSIEDDRIHIDIQPDAFARPFRLTPFEAVTLAATSQALLAVPGADHDGPLARALNKIAVALGTDLRTIVEVDVGRARVGVLETLAQARSEHRQVRIVYYSYGRDVVNERVVDPYLVHIDESELYLWAWCHRANGRRTFRADRIWSATLLDSTFAPPDDITTPPTYAPGDRDPRVTLELDASAAWVVEHYDTESCETLADGRLRVRLAVSGPAWFERLLLGLGPAARVVDAEASLADITAANAARRVLARYEA